MTIKLGAWYFPGWVPNDPGATTRPDPWASNDTTNNIYVGSFPDRTPIDGQFDENDQWVMDKAILDASTAGISWFGMCWYWGISSQTRPLKYKHGIERFLSSPNNHRMEVCLLFDNTTSRLVSLTDWGAAIDYCLANYMHHPSYKKINNKPVMVLFDTDRGCRQVSYCMQNYPTNEFWGDWASGTTYYVGNIVRDAANSLGGGVNAWYLCNTTHAASGAMSNATASWTFKNTEPSLAAYTTSMNYMLDYARGKARQHGFAGLYFVGCQYTNPYWIGSNAGTPKLLAAGGFDAATQYLCHYYVTGQNWATGAASNSTRSESYSEMCTQHENEWTSALVNSNQTIPYWLPISAGFDNDAWTASASRYPTVDTNTSRHNSLCGGNPITFGTHLNNAKTKLTDYPSATTGTAEHAVIYAWNEIGEGGYIIPSAGYNYKFLSKIRSVFGSSYTQQKYAAHPSSPYARGTRV